MDVIKNKKKFRRLVIAFFLLCFLILFAVLVRGINQTSAAWYDSNWSYRRTVYIKDIPKEFQNTTQDVLIEVDTQTLISENKLVNDCRDIRFVDEDNDTSLRYWIEGGCNTDETQVWVNLQLPRSSEKIIYLYYGNKLATDNQESWNGEFITISTNSCQNNWTVRETFQGKFALIGSDFAKTGGSETHTHELFTNSNENCDTLVNVSQLKTKTICNTDNDNIINSTLTHTSNIPNYKNVSFCGSKNGYLNSSSIIFTDTTTPQNWEHVSELDNKFIRGNDDTKPDASTSHVHYTTCINETLSASNGSEQYIKVNDTSRTTSTKSELPYINLNAIKNKNNPIPENSLLLVTSLPPLGWKDYKEAQDKFIKVSNTNLKTSTNNEHLHYHIPDMSISVENTTKENISALDTKKVCLLKYPDNEEDTSFSSILPPYITTPLAQKKSGLRGTLEITIGTEDESGEVLGISSAPTKPTDLETEGKTNPDDVTTFTPGFTAIFNHPDYP